LTPRIRIRQERWTGATGAVPADQIERVPVYQAYGIASLDSFWDWVLCILTWGFVCNRTLGVPHDMVRRARRAPEVAEKVDMLALITSQRIGGIYDRAGVLIGAGTGFALAALGIAGFKLGLELAKAMFLLAFPLTIVAYSTLRLALSVRQYPPTGARLWRSLGLRRFWHTVIALVGLMFTASLAVVEHPSLMPH
jgi:hypothetical protein